MDELVSSWIDQGMPTRDVDGAESRTDTGSSGGGLLVWLGTGLSHLCLPCAPTEHDDDCQ